MKNLSQKVFVLIAVTAFGLILTSCTAVMAMRLSDHREVSIVDVPVLVHQASFVEADQSVAPAILPTKVAAVPKTKVFNRSTYFGMVVGIDITTLYESATIRFKCNSHKYYSYRPPILSLL